jgi:hypothetical protein
LGNTGIPAVTPESEEVAGAIHLVLHQDGSIEFSCTGLFKTAPQALADLLERCTKTTQ